MEVEVIPPSRSLKSGRDDEDDDDKVSKKEKSPAVVGCKEPAINPGFIRFPSRHLGKKTLQKIGLSLPIPLQKFCHIPPP